MPGRPFVSGDTVDLCPVDEDDLGFLQDTVNDPAVWRTIGARTPTTERQEREWYEEQASEDDGNVNFVVAVDGDPVGTMGVHGLDDVNGSAELGVFLAEEHWGEGYGTEAGRLATTYAFDQHRRHRVVARVFEGNEASMRVWEKLGFELDGTHRDEVYVDVRKSSTTISTAHQNAARSEDGAYHDVRYYSVLEDDWGG